MDINLKSAFFGTQIAAKQMIKQGGGGRIINITSVHEDWPMPGNTAVLPVEGRHAHADPHRRRRARRRTASSSSASAPARWPRRSTRRPMNDPAQDADARRRHPARPHGAIPRRSPASSASSPATARATSPRRPSSPTAASCTAAPGCSRERAWTSAYDVIIIGSGAGGGTLAHRLAPSGKRILILERGDWLPREVENWDATAVFVDNRYVSPDTWYDKRRQAVPAADPLLRRRRHQAVRRGAVPAARAGLRRVAPSRRHLAGVAGLLRRLRAVLHRRPSSCTRCTASAARTRPSRRAAARIRSRRSPTSRGSSSCSTT